MKEIQTEHGFFTSNEITGQTAEEVYQEWLANKDKPPLPTELEELSNYVLDVDFRVVMLEMGL